MNQGLASGKEGTEPNRIATSDRAALSQAIHQHYGAVVRICQRIVGNPADAEDAAQETFTRMIQHLDTFDSELALKPWLYKIAVNVSLKLRQEKRKKAAEPLANREIPAAGQDVAGPLIHREEVAEARALIARLFPHYQQVIGYRLLYGFSYREISQILGIPESSVRVTFTRAIRQLHERLSETGERKEP